jgi:hypothetical protein
MPEASTTSRPAPADADVAVPKIVDARPRRRRLLGPFATLGGSAVVLGYLFAVDPNQPGHYPVCPTRALLGIDCPGCGLMRGTHDLLHGNVAGALDHNVLLAVLVPLAVVLWARWVRRAWTGVTPEVTRAQLRRRNNAVLAGVVLLLAFGVVRNLVPYLGSGLS